MKYVGILLLLCMHMHTCSFFDYDRAIGWAQQKMWPEASKLLNSLVTQEPDNPELVYDAGVAAFNNEDYQQAKTYFESAAHNDKAPRALKAQAHFNKGNAHVALQELKEALDSYEKTLMLNPEDQQAKHNYETVKKMLEQQEQQNQQQNDQKCDKDNKQDQQKDQSKEQQKNKQQDNNRSPSNNKDNAQDEKQNDLDDSQADNGKEQEEHEDRKDDGLEQKGDQQDKQEDGLNQEEDESQEDKERDEGGDFDQKPQSDEQQCEQEEKKDHGAPSDKNQTEQQQQDKQGEQKEQEIDQEGPELPEVTLDPRLERALEKRSDRDAQLNKQVVKALVSQEMKGHHGQNCW